MLAIRAIRVRYCVLYFEMSLTISRNSKGSSGVRNILDVHGYEELRLGKEWTIWVLGIPTLTELRTGHLESSN